MATLHIGNKNQYYQNSSYGYASSYDDFRKNALSGYKTEYKSNINMRRPNTNFEKIKDPEYMEKRKKNNEAAKRSRETRKTREDETALRVEYLERKNLELKYRLASLEKAKNEYLKAAERLKYSQECRSPNVWSRR